MSYVTNTEISVSRVAPRGYPKTCLETKNTTSRVLDLRDEHVTSWRGPIEEIRVGSKRRRVFRHFNVMKFNHIPIDGPNIFCWAPPELLGVWCLKGDEANVTIFKDVLINSYRKGINEHIWGGSKFPIYGLAEHEDFVKPYRDQVIQDLFVKLKEPRYDSTVFLAELGETLVSIRELIWGSIKALTKAGQAWKYVKHFSLNTEELWLWYRYCLIPTMLDMEDLLKAIKPQARIDRVQTGMPKKTFHESGECKFKAFYDGTKILRIPWEFNAVYSAGGAIDVTKRVDPHEWGTSAVDILRAGWEVIPFSFIFDWFIGVGDFLTSLRQLEIEYAQSYATLTIDSMLHFNLSDNQSQDFPSKTRFVLIDRIIDLEPPNHPLVNAQWMNVQRSIDAISLAAGIIKKILGRGMKRR